MSNDEKYQIKQKLIGRSYDYASRFLSSHGIKYRILNVDRFHLKVTMDYKRDRVNLHLKTPVNFPEMADISRVWNYIDQNSKPVIVSNVTFG